MKQSNISKSVSKDKKKNTTAPPTESDALRTVYELQAHQIKLEAAFRQYTDLYDFAPVGYLTLARNGTIHQVNLAGANLLGVDHNEATRIRLAAFIFSESRPVYNVFFEKLLSGEGKETCELAFGKKGSELLWVRLEATCFEGGDMCRAMMTDITEHKRMERALQESENRFRMLLQDVSTIAIQGYGIDGTIQYWNTASEKLYGYSAQEALGQNLLGLIIPPETQSEVRQSIQQMAETGQPIPAAEQSMVRKDGSHVTVYSSHAIVSIPGRAPELFCLDVDLTERKWMTSLLQARVRISEFAESHTLDELLQKTLDEVEALTDSQVGFAHFLEADQKTLQLQAWSTNTLKTMCNIEDLELHYPVDQAGVWTDCIAERAPVIHNDYASLPASRRKGLPKGHAPILRELVVPVMRNDLIVMLMGAGNKLTDYDDNDVKILSQLANLAWDIIQRKQFEEALRESEARNRALVEAMPDLIFVQNRAGMYIEYHANNPQLMSAPSEVFLGHTTHDVFPPALADDLQLKRDQAFQTGEIQTHEYMLELAGGQRHFEILMNVYGDDRILGVVRDITERKRVELELQYMKEGLESANHELQAALVRQQQLAHTDELTGINNRRWLYELAEREFKVATRYQQPFSVIMFDIDHFKNVNDTFGHAAGDQMLQRVTQVACAELRSADVIGRYGGEEFVIILPITNAQQAYSLAERIRVGVAAIRVPTEQGDASVTLSIGIVEKTQGAQTDSVERLIRDADTVMYAAKQAGRNRTEIGNG